MDIVIKYIAWILSIGIPFCGAWFYQYTTTEEGTDRKKITIPGKVAFAFTILSIALALVVTIRADINDKRSDAARMEEAVNDLAYRKRTVQMLANSTEHVKEILAILAKDVKRLDTDDLMILSEFRSSAIDESDSSLNNVIDEFPELNEEINDFEEAVRLEIAKRFIDTPQCAQRLEEEDSGLNKILRVADENFVYYLNVNPNGLGLNLFPRHMNEWLPPEKRFPDSLSLFAGGKEYVVSCSNLYSNLNCDIRLDDQIELLQAIKEGGISQIVMGNRPERSEFTITPAVADEIGEGFNCFQ